MLHPSLQCAGQWPTLTGNCASSSCNPTRLIISIGRQAAVAVRLQVPEGHVWLQGDNTLNSTDSRHYGAVPYALLKGRAFLKVPLSALDFPHFEVQVPY